MTLYGELIRLTEKLNEHKLPYAVIGGLAVAYHATARATDDLDFLFLARDVGKVREVMHELGYLFESVPWTFQNTKLTVHRFSRFDGEQHMIVDVMISDEDRYANIVDRAVVAQTAAGPIRFAAKEDLIWLKKFRNSKQDQADIEAIEKNAQRGPTDAKSK